ncbi:arf-GAP with Rho-GAP domain, ANK repeat and PH domain-containing protein 1-like isoform X2 [Branchiostoma lanceolatum]|uniref:arf-GAP with Rho-GAP domain, ANK repeat and PH domain-containing protein 1-like isoform X2 n=1 Tax=Branchiostoma lanceolatum TaxID=7740 RepID=UPI0034564813
MDPNMEVEVTSVQDWLQAIQLEVYVQLFTNQGYTQLSDCCNLNDDTLHQIGINRPGHCRRILKHLPISCEGHVKMPAASPIELSPLGLLSGSTSSVDSAIDQLVPLKLPPKMRRASNEKSPSPSPTPEEEEKKVISPPVSPPQTAPPNPPQDGQLPSKPKPTPKPRNLPPKPVQNDGKSVQPSRPKPTPKPRNLPRQQKPFPRTLSEGGNDEEGTKMKKSIRRDAVKSMHGDLEESQFEDTPAMQDDLLNRDILTSNSFSQSTTDSNKGKQEGKKNPTAHAVPPKSTEFRIVGNGGHHNPQYDEVARESQADCYRNVVPHGNGMPPALPDRPPVAAHREEGDGSNAGFEPNEIVPPPLPFRNMRSQNVYDDVAPDLTIVTHVLQDPYEPVQINQRTQTVHLPTSQPVSSNVSNTWPRPHPQLPPRNKNTPSNEEQDVYESVNIDDHQLSRRGNNSVEMVSCDVYESKEEVQNQLVGEDVSPYETVTYDQSDSLSDSGDDIDAGGASVPWTLPPTEDDDEEECKSIPISAGPMSYMFSGSNREIRKNERCGYLEKQGGKQGNKGWKKRWVVFDGSELIYFESKEKAQTSLSKRIIPAFTMTAVSYPKGDTSKPNRFNLETRARTYQFAAANNDEMNLWASSLMQAIIEMESKKPDYAFKDGGEMWDYDKKGWLKLEGTKGKSIIVIKGGRLCYYNTTEDFEAASPISRIEMKLASVKEPPARTPTKWQLATPFQSYMFTAESKEEANEWVEAMEEAIGEGLADYAVLHQVWEIPSNKYCADCGSPDPDWATVNLGVVVCKQCSGIHREIGTPICKHRSLKMDLRVWTEHLVMLLKEIANHNANHYLQYNLPESERIMKDSPMELRREFILNKYRNRKYIKPHQHYMNQQKLNEALCKAVVEDEIMETYHLVMCGADVDCSTGDPEKPQPYYLAESANKVLQMEFLKQNGASDSPGESKTSISTIFSNAENRDPIPQQPVSLKGWLHKTGHTSRSTIHVSVDGLIGRVGDFQKRWCILEDNVLSYYADDKDPKAKNMIETKDILCVHHCNPDMAMKSGSFSHKSKLDFLHKPDSSDKDNHKKRQSRIRQSVRRRKRPPQSVEIDDMDMDRFVNCFELSTFDKKYMFCADTPEDRVRWIHNIAKCCAPPGVVDKMGDFDRAGYLYMKDSPSLSWVSIWCNLKGKSLNYWNKSSRNVETVDLRKLVTFSQHTETLNVDLSDKSYYMSVVVHGRPALSLKGEGKKDTDDWYAAIQKASTEGGTNLQEQQLTSENIPVIVDRCLEFVTTHGLQAEGIYRLNGTHLKIEQLLRDFNTDARSVRLKLGDHSVHDVANCLKRYFRNLEDPLLTKDLHDRWVEVAGYDQREHDAKLAWFKHYLEKLQDKYPINYATLKKMIGHLKSVSDYCKSNKMTSTNLSAVFGPTLMASDMSTAPGYGGTNQEIETIGYMIDYYAWLFDVSDSEIQKEKEIQRQIKMLMEAQQMQTQTNDILMEVYLEDKTGQRVNVKVSPDSTSEQLCSQIISLKGLRPDRTWALFEVIGDGDLQRMLHYEERVFPVLESWKDHRESAANYLCMKHNFILERMEETPDRITQSSAKSTSHPTPWCQLKYCEDRRKIINKYSFEKYFFEVSGGRLSYYKDTKSREKPIAAWQVEGFNIYVGVEKKKSPPTKFGFTVVLNGETLTRTACCDNEEEMFKWVCHILKLKYPQGLQPPTPLAPMALYATAPGYSQEALGQSYGTQINPSRTGGRHPPPSPDLPPIPSKSKSFLKKISSRIPSLDKS